MHIKQITISNFRSFRQQPEIHPFAPTTNCVVGRNGSGKSNLFDAIQFVLLSPRFATLRSEERQALLHEGSGSAAVNAFVEVVFDNSDNRFSLEHSDEVVLRRTVGSKKDEFFLQRKRATKQEVQSLLEGAGFSKSNPYFMVQQGKIQTLCVMTDANRLQLLQQVAGTTLYEDKKAESLSKMEENQQSIDKINSILADIDQRLQELQGETEELTAYQSCDRKRKALEYTLYDKELRKARLVLDTLEHERMEHAQELTSLHEQSKQTHDAIQNAEGILKVKSHALKRNRIKLDHAEADKTKAVTLKTKLSIQSQELQDAIQAGDEMARRTKLELQRLQKEIQMAKSDYDTQTQRVKEETKRLNALTQQQDQARQRIDALYTKQGRGSQYSSKEERDKSLRKQIRGLQSTKADKEQQLRDQRDALAGIRRAMETENQQMESTRSEQEQLTRTLQSLTKAIDEKQATRISLVETRQQAWRTAEEFQDKTRDAREAMHRATMDMRKVIPRATGLGLRALQSIVEEERLRIGEQYFGMLLDNMTLKDPKYQTAVEVAAQNSLFHVIVDTDVTAARLMQRLEQGKLGRVTFLPLNRLTAPYNRNPPPQSADVTPLLQACIDYDPKIHRAMEHVFDRKYLARTSDVASDWSSKYHVDAITLDGDLCSRKGALTGGYVDKSKSRMNAHRVQHQSRQELDHCTRQFQQADTKARQAEQDVTNVGQDISRLKQKHAQMSRKSQLLESQYINQSKQLKNLEKQAEKLETYTLPPLEREIASTAGEITRLEEEIGTELASTLSEDDRAMLANLKKEVAQVTTTIQSQRDAVERLDEERQRLESLLEDNLLKRRQELTEAVPQDDDDDNEDDEARSQRRTKSLGGPSQSTLIQEQRKQDLKELQQQLQEAERAFEDIEQRLEDARAVEEQYKQELLAAKNELEKLKSQDMKNVKLLEEASERSEKLMSKKSMNISKRETYMRKIQELGSLPPPTELENHKHKSISDLMKALEKVNKKLKKYSHVNKKAFDQYVNFSEQRESLLKRKDELDRGAEKVKELVESLDRKKDEAINRTFRGVSAHFKEVFKELVPLGSGELIMRTSIDDVLAAKGADDESDEDAMRDEDGSSSYNDAGKNEKSKQLPSAGKLPTSKDPDVSLYKGVGIKVRFSSVGENFIMSQLSGGQKALVALALIFAIQRCDPAPFYIFDELDQALDSTYRQAVANLIQRQANSSENPTQFITSTFRPELVAVAKNCYGISHQNKVSSIHHMSKNDALKFIANLMSEEEAVGEVTTLGAGRESRKRKSSSIADVQTAVVTEASTTVVMDEETSAAVEVVDQD